MSTAIVKQDDGTFATEESGLINDVINVATSPLALMNDEDKFINAKAVGVGLLASFVGGVFVGDKWGDRIPVLGGRR